jgi:uncharacterized protein (TIGR00297 family)
LAAGGLGYLSGTLNRSGAVSAWLIGAITFGFGGWQAAGLLIAFFVSSSALSRVAGRRKTHLQADFAKGGRRDWGQVLANGGLVALLALGAGWFGDDLWMAALVGALAAVNADTWATELGVLSPRKPRLITNWRPVQPGTSGGVTLVGLLASLVGAALIAGLGAWWWGNWALLAAGVAGGLAGSLVDSLLGASIQAMYFCPSCDKETERFPEHSCGTNTRLVRGWVWLNNDWVNLTAATCGTASSVLIILLV